MNFRRIVWFGVSTLALASWFASASTSGVRPPVVPLAPPKPSAVDFSMARLQSEVGRLHERIGPASVPSRSRDLFRFSVRGPRRSTAVVTPPPAAVVADAAPEPVAVSGPAFALIGIAEEPSADGVMRTAIVSLPGDLFLVKTGEMIQNRYRVDQVSSDAVQVVDTATQQSFTLALR